MIELTGSWKLAFTKDFYGQLKNCSKFEKNDRVLSVYKLFFRFSVEKLNNFLDDPSLMTLFLSYLRATGLERFDSMQSLKLNATCYYRAAENMVNLSHLRARALMALRSNPLKSKLKFTTVCCLNHSSDQNLEKSCCEVDFTL